MSQLMKNSSKCLMLLILSPAAYADDTTSQSDATSQASEEAPKLLSVAPLDYIEYPDDREEWVSQPTNFDEETHTIVVVSGPSETREESIAELKLMQRAAVSTYISRITDSGGVHDFYPISDASIDSELVVRRYSGEVLQGDMTRYENAIELAFTKAKRREIESAWNHLEVRDRLGALGVIVFGGLVALLCSSGLVGMVSRRVERRDKMQASISA